VAASIDKRIADLERRLVPPEDEGAELRRAVIRDILDELAALKSRRARNSYGGGNPPTPIQPTDPAGEALGYPYTRGELVGFAVRRVFERAREEDSNVTDEATEDLIAAWTENLRSGPFGERWEEIEAEGPPGEARPYR
jgi:hypothetical protein